MSTNQNKEEVDLGSLFVIIGKGFSNFFSFIGSIFKRIFHFFISILIFLKKNIVKISIAGFIGVVLGFYLEISKIETYRSELIIQPNFKSTRQLYTTLDSYNNLIAQKDTASIQKIFGFDKNLSGGLVKFIIEPVVSDNDIINSYNDLVLELDSLTIKSYDYIDLKNTFTKFDYKVHKIKVISKNKNVFTKIGEVIVGSVQENVFFNTAKRLKNKNLKRSDSLYRRSLGQIDSLRRVYMHVMLAEANKQTTGTNIDLGGNKKETKELQLFEINKDINEELNKVLEEQVEKSEIVNIISNFQFTGEKVKGVSNNYAFILGVLGAVLMILIILLFQLNKYLENYSK